MEVFEAAAYLLHSCITQVILSCFFWLPLTLEGQNTFD